MRCLYCGKQLALFKKLTGGGEFCSDAHKQSYHEEYNKLALSRLMEAQTRQDEHTPRPPGGGVGQQSASEKPATPEPKAKGGYFKPTVSPQNPEIAIVAGFYQRPGDRPIELPPFDALHFAPEPVRAGVMIELRAKPDGAAAPAFPIRLPAEMSLRFPASAELQTDPSLGQGGVIMVNRPVPGAVAITSPAAAPAGMALALPVTSEVAFEPQLAGAGVIMENRPVPGAAAIAAPAATPAGMAIAFPVAVELPFEPQLSGAGVVMENRPVPGAAAIAAPAATPAGMSLAFPSTGELRFEPQVREPGMVTVHHPVPGAPVTPASAFLRSCFDAGCTIPEGCFETDSRGLPAAIGMVVLDLRAAGPPEPELRCESALGIEWICELPQGFGPDWAEGLDLGSAEEKVTALPSRCRQWAPPEATGVEQLTTPMELAPVEAALAEAAPAECVVTAATLEPVIDDALLLALFGGGEKTPSEPKQETSVPAVVEASVENQQTAEQAQAGTPTTGRMEGPVAPHEPGSFLPVTIRPAGAPSKSRLMQSFQAIALVSANPQIPTWNMLPLRPRMMLGRPPGPGASLLDRAKPDHGARSEVRKPASMAVEVADGPDPSADVAVPTFGSAAKPRSGLSRWFKLGILAGVLGIAGSSNWFYHPVERGSAGVMAEARQNMTTEFAVCRN
jgi:hypothetical protein